MQQVLKWIGIVLVAVIGLAVVVGAGLHFWGSSRVDKAPDVAVATVSVPADAATLVRGAHLAHVSSCTDCHGPDLAGTVFVDEAPIGYIPTPDLTAGKGGVGASYDDEKWAQAIRHGVAADDRAILVMPSNHYAHYGDDDLGALIAYLQSIPGVDNELGVRRLDFPGTIIFGVMAYDGVAAVANIEHEAVGGNAPAMAVSSEYGEYLVNIASCNSCHGENLTGATNPDSPQGPNITMGGALQFYDEAAFMTALRTGVALQGRQLSEEMPWQNYSEMSDTELQALWSYISELPVSAPGSP